MNLWSLRSTLIRLSGCSWILHKYFSLSRNYSRFSRAWTTTHLAAEELVANSRDCNFWSGFKSIIIRKHPCNIIPPWIFSPSRNYDFIFPHSKHRIKVGAKLFHFARLSLSLSPFPFTLCIKPWRALFIPWYYRIRSWNWKSTIKFHQSRKFELYIDGWRGFCSSTKPYELAKLLSAQRIVWLQWLQYSRAFPSFF